MRKIKITQEQYKRLVNEVELKGGANRVDKAFKKSFKNADVENLAEEPFDIKKPNPNIPGSRMKNTPELNPPKLNEIGRAHV